MTMTNKQAINGILLVNKPQGLTSNAVLQRVKRLFQAKKAGHTGSLDPLATGMLPICFGEATKFSQYLLEADKSYDVVGLLGIQTDTADAMGEVIAQTTSFAVSESQLLDVLSRFSGNIQQTPSMFSALKHQGKPLYRYARAGITIERKTRDIMIYALHLNRFDGTYVDLTITCSKGTYIRNLIEDIGTALGVGAHVTRLHRRYTAGFCTDMMFTLEELEAMSNEMRHQCLLPVERAIAHLAKIILSDEAVAALRQGQQVTYSLKQTQQEGERAMYTRDNHFIGLGMLELSGVLRVKRLLNA